MLAKLLAVGLGGSIGAIARYGVSVALRRAWGETFPWPTLIVNVAGCLLLGALMGAVAARGEAVPEWVRLALGVGLLGSLTTFSTFGFETVELARDGRIHLAAAYAGANLAVGLVLVVVGHAAATRALG